MTANPGPEPPYCKALLGKPLTPSQWTTCWKYGWDEHTNTIARIGHDFGHNVLPILIVGALVVLFITWGFGKIAR